MHMLEAWEADQKQQKADQEELRRLRVENVALLGQLCWTPVDEDEPEPGLVVLVTDGRSVCSGHQNTRTGEWDCENFMDGANVTHWRPMPAPPRSAANDASRAT